MARYVQIAMGSGAELSCHLLLSKDPGYLSMAEYEVLYDQVSEILRMLSALAEKLRNPVRERVVELKAKG